MRRKTIVILYSEAKRKFFKTEEHYKTEAEVFERSKVVKKRLDKMGYETILLPGNSHAIKKLEKIKPQIVFNLVDSVGGREDRTAVIPAALDLLDLPYSGAGIEGLTICSNKYLTKAILKLSGIPVPGFQLFADCEQKLDQNLKMPLIVKLNESHGSLEICQESIVTDSRQLKARVKYLIDKYGQSVLVEEYIKGKEITALMIDGKNKIILAEERIFFKKEKYSIFSYEAAWGEKEIYDCTPYPIGEKLKGEIIRAFKLLKFEDYGRFEILIDNQGKHYFIDPNANPALGPYGTTSGPFGYLLHSNGILFETAIEQIIKNILLRFR